MSLEAIKFKNGKLEIIDQLKLPFETSYIELNSIQDCWDSINQMKVRGAPAIAICGVLGVASQLIKTNFGDITSLKEFTSKKYNYLLRKK